MASPKKGGGFDVWPRHPGFPYGPRPKQRLLFIESLPDVDTFLDDARTGEKINIKRPHYHPIDVVLYIGGARCFGKDTPVLMYDGTIRAIQDIKLGEQVMGPDSAPRTVKHVEQGTDILFKITPRKGMPFVCNDNHVLLLQSVKLFGGKRKVLEIEAGEFFLLPEKDQKQWRLFRSGPINFAKNAALPIDPYILGSWLGDGNSREPMLTNQDREVKAAWKRCASKMGMKVRTVDRGNGTENIFLISNPGKRTRAINPFRRFLRTSGLICNKHIPNQYLLSSKKQRLQLLAGLIDTDGTLSKNSAFVICQTNEKLASQIAFLARSLGFSVTQRKDRVKGHAATNAVSITGNIETIPVRIPRKKPHVVPRIDPSITGFTIEKLGKGQYFGFELEEDSTFLLGDFTVVHNSGKTIASVARQISYLMNNDGAVAIVGAVNYPLLTRTMMKEWGDRFKVNNVPWGGLRDKNNWLIKKPTQTDKRAILKNGSQAYFLHLTDDEVLRGIDADIIAFEEASLIPDEASYEELGRRLSGRKGPIRQLILTTNPSGRGNWIDEKFKLHQLRENFTGEPEPLIDPCSCHKCTICKTSEYVNGFCERCGKEKHNSCPGNQVWVRVIQTKSSDNDTLHEDYTESMKGFMDEKTHAVFVGGATDDLRQGEVYKAFTDDNMFRVDQPFDLDKDLIWTLDFNFEPQCSMICQEHETTQGFQIKVLDEIVLWNALPEHAALAFCNHPEVLQWKQSNRTVYVYGDPAGLYGTGNNLAPSFYKIIYDTLSKHGFDVRIMMRKPDKDAVIKEPVKIPIAGRVDAVNAMLRTAEDPPRIRLMINPRCRFLKRSLRELRWAEDGKNIDKSVDKRAARRPDKSNAVMTHPSDALGYYVYKRFPIVKNKRGVPFIQVPGQTVYEIRGGSVIEAARDDLSDRVKKRIEERHQRRAERQQKRDEEKRKRDSSIKGSLSRLGVWGNDPFNLF